MMIMIAAAALAAAPAASPAQMPADSQAPHHGAMQMDGMSHEQHAKKDGCCCCDDMKDHAGAKHQGHGDQR